MIPKKKSRRIVVQTIPFRWLRKGTSHLKFSAPPAHSITVQHENGGRILQFNITATEQNIRYTLREEEEAWVGVTPILVERVIEEALREGWDPQEPSSVPFRIQKKIDLGPDWEIWGISTP